MRERTARIRTRLDGLYGRIRHGATAWDVLWDAVGSFRANGDANQAAAIALYAILSLIPLVILTLVVAGRIFHTDSVMQTRMMEEIRTILPYLSDDLLDQLGQIEAKAKVLGWAGIISLVWLSSAIFGVIETALDIIFRSSQTSRRYVVSKLLAIGMIPLGWTIGTVSIGIAYLAAYIVGQPIFEIVNLNVLVLLVHDVFFRYGLPFLLTASFTTIVYRVIPKARVSLSGAFLGSLIFAGLAELAKYFFTWYVANYARYHDIFGSLETVVLLVIWVFYIALIFLFCAELVSSYQKKDLILLEKAMLKPSRSASLVSARLFRRFGRLYPRGSCIFKEGDAGREMFYVLTGRVEVEKEAGQVRKLLAVMGPGDYFGEMAALIDAPRTASAVAVEDSDIAAISGDTFRDLLRKNGEVSLLMLQEFSRRLKHTNRDLEDVTRAWIRLAAILYFLREWPLPDDRDPVAELAASTGEDREEIHDVLAELARQGVVEMEAERVTGFAAAKAWELMDRRADADT